MRPDRVEKIEGVSKDIVTDIITDGDLLNSERFKFLCELGINAIAAAFAMSKKLEFDVTKELSDSLRKSIAEKVAEYDPIIDRTIKQ